MRDYIIVVGWEKFQHYKDRNPNWIKLYLSTMTNFKFRALPDSEKYLLIGLWMTAVRTQNRTPLDARYVRDMCGLTARRIQFENLIDAGFIEIKSIDDSEFDSNALAESYQDASIDYIRPKSKREKERESKRTPPNPPVNGGEPEPKKRRKKSEANPEIKVFIDWYFARHLEQFGTKLLITGQDGPHVKRILGTIELDELKIRAERFLDDAASWPNGDKSIRFLVQNINRYASDGQPLNDRDARTQAAMRELDRRGLIDHKKQ